MKLPKWGPTRPYCYTQTQRRDAGGLLSYPMENVATQIETTNVSSLQTRVISAELMIHSMCLETMIIKPALDLLNIQDNDEGYYSQTTKSINSTIYLTVAVDDVNGLAGVITGLAIVIL